MSDEQKTALVARQELPEAVARRGVDEAQWRTLCSSLYPGAQPQSVLMVLDYCKARGLDPLKKPCHIVPMRVKAGDVWVTRDVVMPGIYEYRITAHRTGEYMGHSRPEYGPMVEVFGVTAPEWCDITVYRARGGERIEFPVRVYFREACATVAEKDGQGKRTGRDVANDRWSKAPIQMLTKCCEAAGLREAFPDELGGEATAEEMMGQGADPEPTTVIQQPQRLSAATTVTPAPVAEPAVSEPVSAVEAPAIPVEVEPEPTTSDKPRVLISAAVRRASSKRPGTHFWAVQDSRGAIYFAMTDEIGEACAAFATAKTPVEITAEPVEGQKYPNIVSIEAQ